MNDQNIAKLVNFEKPHFDPVVICPSNSHKLGFDPSLNGHDFFSKTITCSCINTKNSSHKCNLGEEDGCRRTKKNEYARQQMKKYREKLKQDPVRYKKYLQSERVRNARRKLKKIQRVIAENRHHMTAEQLEKLEKRHQNLLNKAINRLEIKNYDLDDELHSFKGLLNDTSRKTYENNKKRKDQKFNIKNNENNNDNKDIDEILNNDLHNITESQQSDIPSLHFFSSIFDGKKIDKNNATVYEIGGGGPFTNLKIVNNATNSNDYIVPEINLQSEVIDIKEEPISDPENENSISQDFTDFNMNGDESFSDADSLFDDNDFKVNRICAMVNCPSRFMHIPDVKYYPFPPQKDIRDCWINLIKSKTNQWIIDPDAFVCSLHFAPTWFQKSPSYGNKMLLLNAVPTIYPNGTATQFDINIPIISGVDYLKPEKFKKYYDWSCIELREQESVLKEQQFIIENHTEYKIIQEKRIEKLYKVVDEFKKTLNLSSNSKDNDTLKSFLQQIDDLKTDLI